MSRALVAVVALALLLGGCTRDDAERPPEAGTATTETELSALADRVHRVLASTAPTGEARAEVLRTCIDLRRTAEYVATSKSDAARELRDGLGDAGTAALADAARDCTLDEQAARAATERLRDALR